MSDSITTYCKASAAGDLDAVMAVLAEDVGVISPISGRMVFRGHADVRFLFGAVYGTLRDLTWGEPIGSGGTRVAVAAARVGPVRMTDAMVFELAPDGRIQRVSPHLRPWLALTLFAALLGPKVARRPSVVLRALRG